MPQSYTDNLQHIVFSTKERRAIIGGEWCDELYAFIGGVAKKHRCSLIGSGGMDDHVHLLVRVHPTIAVANLVRDMKANSSRWVRLQRPRIGFRWQKGYGAFSVSRSNEERVMSYLAGQEEHHRRMTFKEEFLELLRRHEIEWDERYVWE